MIELGGSHHHGLGSDHIMRAHPWSPFPPRPCPSQLRLAGGLGLEPFGEAFREGLCVLLELRDAWVPDVGAVGARGIEVGGLHHGRALRQQRYDDLVLSQGPGVVLRHDLLDDLPLHGVDRLLEERSGAREVHVVEACAEVVAVGHHAALRIPHIAVHSIHNSGVGRGDVLLVREGVGLRERGHDHVRGDVDDLPGVLVALPVLHLLPTEAVILHQLLELLLKEHERRGRLERVFGNFPEALEVLGGHQEPPPLPVHEPVRKRGPLLAQLLA
mmetsp:Transcript_38036/g.89876  ORF Transcript_38036/g.89876 Transcript_38036/m.89876 type:complete len:272 (+) Transcript_38036:273-1088(+)